MSEPQYDRFTLLMTLAIAAGIGLLLTMLVIMPAEYDVDPTGFGELVGLTDLNAEFEDDPVINVTGTEISVFPISYPTTSTIVVDASGTLGEGESVSFDLGPYQNVTQVTAILAWSDTTTVGEPVEPELFELTIEQMGEDRRRWQGYGTDESIEAVYTIGRAPDARVVEAADETTARTVVGTNATTSGWHVEVTLVDADDFLIVPDEEADYTLFVFVTTYELAVAEAQETNRRTDTIEVTVPPESGIEYKVRMQEGDRFEYAWTSSDAVYFDFHAANHEGSEESFKTGTAASDDGVHIAPFDGLHGWYWENQGNDDVVVTLELAGTYTIESS